MSQTLRAHVTVTPPISIDTVYDIGRTTPGNVGVCLSGGGSRACSAGMGQLRALRHLKANGKSLLSQVKAISTVSGGSWLGVPFTYLPENVSDEAYLNSYVADPGELVPSNGDNIAVTLNRLPEGNIGAQINSRTFSIPAIAVQAFLLWRFKKTPANMLWQTVIGSHLLKPYGLHVSGTDGLPNSFFTSSSPRLHAIRQENPVLVESTGHIVATGPDHASRPYLICNTSMFVDTSGDMGQPALAPVQANPMFTGIVSLPDGTDANGQPVGGGGISSFAFNSALAEIDTTRVQVEQDRLWSLTDIVGASSAAFAGELEQILRDPEVLLDHLVEYAEEAVDWLVEHLGFEPPFDIAAETPEFLKRSILGHFVADVDIDVGGIIPAYRYWPVRDASPEPEIESTRFADGGNLENTGIAGMLSYSDIDSIIAFINSATPMVTAAHGIIDENGHEEPGTLVIVDDQVPPLFGYQPYDRQVGYLPFSNGDESFDSRSQIFPREAFADLLRQWWKVSGNQDVPGSNASPAICQQNLTTIRNDWFGVAPGRNVKVVWMYLNDVNQWRTKLNNDVQVLLNDVDDFPHYKTLNTSLSATEINLLSSLTAWCVGNPENADTFSSLFQL